MKGVVKPMKQIISHLSVKEVYNKIANHFNHSRQRIWGSVKLFIDSLPAGASVLELGCGNGKNMLHRSDIHMTGIDISTEQVRICRTKQLDVKEGCITSLNFPTESFDNMLCIATYHHLDNDGDRQKALQEMYRCLRPGGTILLTVWAMEQPDTSTFHFTKTDELVPWNSKDDGNIYLRYYHIYNKGDLYEEITRLCPEFTWLSGDWELGNWYCILQKPHPI